MSKSENQSKRFDYLRPVEFTHEEAIIVSTDSVPYPISDIFIGKTYPYPKYQVKRKATGKYYIFEYVISGKGEIFFDGEWHKILAGDTYIIHKNTARNYHSDQSDPLEKIWLSFFADYVDSMLSDCGISTGVYRADVRGFFEDAFRVANSEDTVKDKTFKIAGAINAIIMEIAKTLTLENDDFTKIKSSILELLYKKGSLDEIASRFFMSKSNLIRVFKKRTGTTPYKFLLDEKIRISKVLLKTTSMSVRAIAEQFSFTDEHYFSFVFKERVGKTPLKYRNDSNK